MKDFKSNSNSEIKDKLPKPDELQTKTDTSYKLFE